MAGLGSGAERHHHRGKSCMCSNHCGEAHRPSGLQMSDEPPLRRFLTPDQHPQWLGSQAFSEQFLHSKINAYNTT